LLPRETFFSINNTEIAATYNDMLQLGIAHMPYDHIIIGVPGDIIVRSRLELDDTDDQLVHIYFPGEDGPSKLIEPQKLASTSYHDTFNFVMREWEDLGNTTVEARDWEFRFHYWNTIKGNNKHYRTMARFNPHSPWKDMSAFYLKDSESRLTPREREIARASLEIRLQGMGLSLRNILIVLLATRNAIKTRTKDKLLALGIGKRKLRNNNKPLYTTTITVPALPAPKVAGKPTGRTVAAHLRRGHKRDQRWGPRLQFVKAVWIAPCFVNADDTYISTRVAYNTNLTPEGDSP
jgi:hypothetical protein